MTKKEKAILKLAQKWAKVNSHSPFIRDIDVEATMRKCGRALLKILEP